MQLAEAVLVNRDFEPGWPIVADDVPLGKRYLIDLDRVSGATITNALDGRERKCACVWVLEPEPPGWMPVVAFGFTSDLVDVDVTPDKALPAVLVGDVCRPMQGARTCSYLAAQAGLYFCAKGTAFEAVIVQRRRDGTLKSMGDNCSGPPEFR